MPHASSDRQKLCLIVPSHELAGYGLSIKSNCSIHTSSIVKSVLHNFNHCYLHTKMDRHTLNKTTTVKLSHDYKNGEFRG